jgi:hypothetical protein
MGRKPINAKRVILQGQACPKGTKTQPAPNYEGRRMSSTTEVTAT